MKVVVLIRPKDGILDPQGDAVGHSLRKLGFDVTGTRVGRIVDLELAADGRENAEAQVQRMCSQLLANPLIESYEVVVVEP